MEGLHFQQWIPEGSTGVAILLIHGAGEHSGRYEHVINWFLARNIAVFAGDLPGFGQSPGTRGHIDRFSDYTDCVRNWLTETKNTVGDTSVFLFGHSMGGLVTVRFLQEPDAGNLPIKGVVLSSPCLRLKMQVPQWKRNLAGVLGRLTPRLRMPNGIAAADVSRSLDVVKKYSEDPYNESRVSIRWFEELQVAMQQAMLQASRIQQPLLLLQAGADRIVDPEAAIPFVEKAGSRDKKLKIYPGLYHELVNEPEKEEVLTDILEWINKRK
ncbi:alpha/beta hydrolase [Effusibacillus consociatus]|uniref:Alpha/beta hydrolase n=1 Tax=Effusibacillus consociatus TaxID=1117041 RepID=A0ABV9Q5J5_9BACL